MGGREGWEGEKDGEDAGSRFVEEELLGVCLYVSMSSEQDIYQKTEFYNKSDISLERRLMSTCGRPAIFYTIQQRRSHPSYASFFNEIFLP